MSEQNKNKMSLTAIIAVIVMLIVVLMCFYIGVRYYAPKEKLVVTPITPAITQTPIEYTAIFKGFEGEVIEKWHECKNIDCISSLMKDASASSDAIAFTKLLYKSNSNDYGYLSQFQEHGVIDERIDLGTVAFPNRANANEVHYLLNGSPAFVSIEEIFQNGEIINEIKQDPLYTEAKNKYPNIAFVDASNPQFVGDDALSNNKRFIFRFELKNGCRTCSTEYFANIGFDFDLDRNFLKTTFLQIIKIIVPEEKWETFKSSGLGFSIKYPQVIYYEAYHCSPKKPFYVPLKVFEDKENRLAYITAEFSYYAPYNGESEKLEPCEKITETLESLRAGGGFYPRTIKMQHIDNDDDLNKFIKDNYFSGCLIESKELWKQQDGVYEIKLNGFKDVNGNDTDLGSSVCPVNYMYKILYAPQKNKAMSVILGQECGFGTDYNAENYKCYDEEMINSFKFE